MKTKDYGTQFDRLYVAMVTPYTEGTFTVDEESLRKLLRYFLQDKFVNAGAGIIINTEAGEIYYLSREEKKRNVEIAVEECAGKVPVFAGVVDSTTEGAVQVALDAKAAGVDGLFFIPPIGALDITSSWNAEKYPEVWLDLIKAIDEAADLPIIVHPVASVTAKYGIGLPLGPTLQITEEIPNVVGWKMTYHYDGYRTIARGLQSLQRHVGIFGAPALYFHESLAAEQFDGTATGSFSYALEPMIDHIEAWRRLDIPEARRIWEGGLAELQEYVYSDYSRLHIRYKIAAWLRGLVPHPLMRPPLPKPKQEEVTTLRALLLKTGLDIISDPDIQKINAQLK